MGTAGRKTLGQRVFGARRIGVVEWIALSRGQLSSGRIFGRVAVGGDESWCGHRCVRSVKGDAPDGSMLAHPQTF